MKRVLNFRVAFMFLMVCLLAGWIAQVEARQPAQTGTVGEPNPSEIRGEFGHRRLHPRASVRPTPDFSCPEKKHCRSGIFGEPTYLLARRSVVPGPEA
jgi:hypothetical protein